MIDQNKFLETLKEEGVQFIAGVPDTLLNDFCLTLEKEWPSDKHIIAANEGNAVGLAAGYHISTNSIPLVYMQNSGLGNCVNPILSLTHKSVYSIPLILLVGWRGDPSRKDHPQHTKQGELTTVLLEDMDIPYRIVEDDDRLAQEDAKWAIETAKETNQAVALIARKGVFEKGEKDGFPKDSRYELTREEAIKVILETLPKDTIYVASTGRATRELHAIREEIGMPHHSDFLNVGAMGHTSSLALGIAIAKKDKLVVCLEGDASALMHLGALTIIGQQKHSNLIHIVLNNGVHESVGGQQSVGQNICLTKIAKSSGYETPENKLVKKSDLITALKSVNNSDNTSFIDFHIQKGIRSDMPPLKFNQQESKQLFMENATEKNN